MTSTAITNLVPKPPRRNITLIAAYASQQVIGRANELLWHIPKDFQWFKQHTLGKTVVMGRNTMESICVYTKGRPLPQRRNIVLTSAYQEFNQPGFTAYGSIEPILVLSESQEVMIIGGQKVYETFMPYATKLILTQIHADMKGDAYFPLFDHSHYRLTHEAHDSDENFFFTFYIYEKKGQAIALKH